MLHDVPISSDTRNMGWQSSGRFLFSPIPSEDGSLQLQRGSAGLAMSDAEDATTRMALRGSEQSTALQEPVLAPICCVNARSNDRKGHLQMMMLMRTRAFRAGRNSRVSA